MNKLEQQQINSLVRDQRWQAVEVFKEKFLKSLDGSEIKAEDEFNTLWNLAFQEGQKDSINKFFNNIEQI